MNKQSMAQKQAPPEQPEQPLKQQAPQQSSANPGAAAMLAAQEARLRARQNAVAKASTKIANPQTAQPQTAQTTKTAPQAPAQVQQQAAGRQQQQETARTVVHSTQEKMNAGAARCDAPQTTQPADTAYSAGKQEQTPAQPSRTAPSQAPRMGTAQKQTVPAAQRQSNGPVGLADRTAVQKPAAQMRTHLPGMPISDDDTDTFFQATPGPQASEQDDEKALPTAKSGATQSRRRQAVLQAEGGEGEGGENQEKRGKGTRKSAGKRKESSISKVAILALFTLAVFLVCGVTVFFQLDQFLFGSFEDVEMPNFDGKNISEIQFNEEYKGFNIKYEDVFTDEEPVGIVVQQNPRAPRKVKENATVTLYVSAGTRTVEVPSLTKMTREEAKSTLKEVGLNPIFKPVTDATAVPDTILHTEPAAGTSINYGETVEVYFTRSEDATKIKVPQCVGLATMSEAIRALATEGLNYELSAESVGDGTITAQLPEAGEMVPRGTKVSLTVSGSAATGLDALPQKQLTGADGHTHEYAPSTVVPSNEYSIGYTIYSCSVCNYFYYDDFTQPSAG